MPIYNLNLRKQLVGKAGNIRKGVKEPVLDRQTGKPKINEKTGEIVTHPKEVDYFVIKVDEADPELAAQIKRIYDKPKKITAFLAASDKERAWDYWLEAYNFNQLIARSDGNIVTYLFDTVTNQKIIDRGRIVEIPAKETPVSELLGNLGVGDMLGYYEGMIVARNKDGEPIFFDAAGRLNIILRDLGRQLYFTLHTGGLYGDVPHITEMVEILENLAKSVNVPIIMIPFTLTRYEVERGYTDETGKKRKRKGWDIRMEVLPEFFSGVLEVYRNTPLMLAATNPARPAGAPKDYNEETPPYVSDEIIEPEWDDGPMEEGQSEPPIKQNGSKAVPRKLNIPVITPAFLVSEQIADNEFHAKMLIQLLMIDGAEVGAGKARIKLYNDWRKIEGYSRNDAKSRKLAAEKAIAGESVPA